MGTMARLIPLYLLLFLLLLSNLRISHRSSMRLLLRRSRRLTPWRMIVMLMLLVRRDCRDTSDERRSRDSGLRRPRSSRGCALSEDERSVLFTPSSVVAFCFSLFFFFPTFSHLFMNRDTIGVEPFPSKKGPGGGGFFFGGRLRKCEAFGTMMESTYLHRLGCLTGA